LHEDRRASLPESGNSRQRAEFNAEEECGAAATEVGSAKTPAAAALLQPAAGAKKLEKQGGAKRAQPQPRLSPGRGFPDWQRFQALGKSALP